MQKPKKTVEQRRWDAEEKAGFWLAEANEAQDRGLSSKEESCLAKAQYWLDRANLLSGQGERRPATPLGRATQMKWKPIDTAPKDGTRVLVWRPRESADHPAHHGIDRWSDVAKTWYNSRRDQQPTHWQPLPAPPTDQSATQ